MISKSRNEIPTIDVNLVTITTKSGKEFGFDTANQVEVEVQTEDEESVKLVVKGILRAQKPPVSTITGHQITLHDNVFNPELVKVLQGGTILYWQNEEHSSTGETETDYGVARYTPPLAGTPDKGEVFTLNAYSAIYNAAGVITGYEKTIYPNCQGVPVAFNSEDGAFRAPEYTINSAPDIGEPPYDIVFVDSLPTLKDPDEKDDLTINPVPGATAEYTEGGQNTYSANTMFSVVEPTTGQVSFEIVDGNEIATLNVDGTTIEYTGPGQVTVKISVDEDATYKSGTAQNILVITQGAAG